MQYPGWMKRNAGVTSEWRQSVMVFKLQALLATLILCSSDTSRMNQLGFILHQQCGGLVKLTTFGLRSACENRFGSQSGVDPELPIG